MLYVCKHICGYVCTWVLPVLVCHVPKVHVCTHVTQKLFTCMHNIYYIFIYRLYQYTAKYLWYQYQKTFSFQLSVSVYFYSDLFYMRGHMYDIYFFLFFFFKNFYW